MWEGRRGVGDVVEKERVCSKDRRGVEKRERENGKNEVRNGTRKGRKSESRGLDRVGKSAARGCDERRGRSEDEEGERSRERKASRRVSVVEGRSITGGEGEEGERSLQRDSGLQSILHYPSPCSLKSLSQRKPGIKNKKKTTLRKSL